MGGEWATLSPSLADLSKLVHPCSRSHFKFQSPTLYGLLSIFPNVTAIFLQKNKSTAVENVEKVWQTWLSGHALSEFGVSPRPEAGSRSQGEGEGARGREGERGGIRDERNERLEGNGTRAERVVLELHGTGVLLGPRPGEGD